MGGSGEEDEEDVTFVFIRSLCLCIEETGRIRRLQAHSLAGSTGGELFSQSFLKVRIIMTAHLESCAHLGV